MEKNAQLTPNSNGGHNPQFAAKYSPMWLFMQLMADTEKHIDQSSEADS